MASTYKLSFVVLLLLGLHTTAGFPQQAVLTTQVENDGNMLLERAERSLNLPFDDEFSGSGDSNIPDESTPETKPPPVKIGSLHISSSTTARFTNTSVTSKLVNRFNVSRDTEVVIRLPEEAFITELFIEVDGKIYRSTVETKEKAQKIYDTARERGQTASQVKQKFEKTNDFSVSINVAPMSSVKCTLIYQQLLLRKKGFFENRISIRPKQIIPDLKVNVHITEPQGLDEVESYLQKEEGNDVTSNDLQKQFVSRTSSTTAHIQFHPSKDEQLAQSQKGIVGDFVIKYDVVHPISGGNIQVVNGYFVHHFSPEGIPPAMKNVVFVIDVSGSMSGTKIKQTREAMLTILDQLREGDTFNIVTFHTYIDTWQPEKMVPVTPGMIESAKDYVRELRALQSTNFYGGIERGVSLLNKFHNVTNNDYVDLSLSMIIILSDGQPTAGVTNLNRIKERTKDDIDGRYSLFTLGFGNDVDIKFLEKLAGQNKGIFRKIYVDSDSSLQLAGFFDDVATPLLINVEFRYPSNIIDDNSVTQTTFPSYFKGSELVVAGKLADGVNVITANVLGTATEHGIIGIKTEGSVQISEDVTLSPHVVDNFAQRLWAYLTIKEMLGKRRISDDAEEKDNLEKEALELSLKYHFVTPLTSLVVVKPDGSNDTAEKVTDRNEQREEESIQSTSLLSYPSSASGIQGGRLGGPVGYNPTHSRIGSLLSADSDPHFLLHVPHGNITVCFNLMGSPGDIFNLIRDTELGINVNAKVGIAVPHPELLKSKQTMTSDLGKRTIFNQMSISTVHHRILVTSLNVTVNKLTMPWGSDWSIDNGNISVAVTEGKYLHMQIGDDVQLIVMLHAVNKNHPGKSDYLGLYVANGAGFSQQVHGIIGQFQQHKVHLYAESVYVDNNFDTNAILRVNHRTVKVKHASRDVLLTDDVETCWFANDNGYGMIDGIYTDYLQDALFSRI